MLNLNKKGAPIFSSAKQNIVFDGNSLVAGDGASSQYLANRVMSLPLLSSSGMAVKSYGISGQTWANMTSNISDITAARVNGRRNILITWEGTNSINNSGRTGLQAATDAKTYVDTLKASQPDWEIYTITTLARRQSASFSINQTNIELEAYNNELIKNYKSLGFAGVVNIRLPNSPFYMASYGDSEWAKLDPYTASGETGLPGGIYVHLNTAGYNVVADLVQQVLRGIG